MVSAILSMIGHGARMRWLLIILSAIAPIAAATIALAADAVVQGGRITVPAPASRPATANRSPAPAASYLVPSPPRAAVADPSDCRMSCAQSNYQCRVQNDAEDCSPIWSQCVAACTMPNLGPPVSTTP